MDLIEGGVEDGGVGVLLEGEDEGEEVTYVDGAGVDEGPAVAEKAYTLGRGEGGFGCGGDGGVLGGGVLGPVVAAGGGVGVEDGDAGVDGDGKGGVRWIKRPADRGDC